jgi:hypothetical protein
MNLKTHNFRIAAGRALDRRLPQSVMWVSLAIIVGCGPKLTEVPDTYPVETKESTPALAEDDDKGETFITIMTSFDTGQAGSLSLATVNEWDMVIEGCASGHSTTADETYPAINLYEFDQGCLAKLQQFVMNGATYVPKTGEGFQTYAEGEYATFVNTADATDTYTIRVAKQLDSPLTASSTVLYGINSMQTDGLSYGFMESTLISEGSATDKNNRMRWILYETKIIGTDAANDTLKFSFTLECKTKIGNENDLNRAYCDDRRRPMININYVLVADDYGGVPCTSRDRSGCRALFDGSEVAIDMNNDYILPKTTLKNGGFRTSVSADALSGPADLASNNRMLLLLELDDGFKFYSIEINTDANF